MHEDAPDNGGVEKLCADRRIPGSVTLDPAAVHLLSNHLTVVLGFVELILLDMPATDPHRDDLLEVRAAAVAAASLLGKATD